MSKFAKKYQPKDFSELVFACPKTEKRLHQYAENQRTKSIILHGDYGTGKSTIARLLIKARDPVNTGFWQTFNCGQDTINFRSLTGAWNISELLKVEPMCVLEEADLLTKHNQFGLRAFMDLHGGMFILTTNYLHAIDGSLLSRCDVIEIKSPSALQYLPAARVILADCGVPIDDIALAMLLREAKNWRQALEALEDLVREHFVRHPRAA